LDYGVKGRKKKIDRKLSTGVRPWVQEDCRIRLDKENKSGREGEGTNSGSKNTMGLPGDITFLWFEKKKPA